MNKNTLATASIKLVAMATTLLVACSASSQAAPPNIVFIMADDLGSGDLGCYNPQSKIPTPNIDRLADQGMRFTDAHSPSAVCTPTRYGVLTGRYSWRSRLKKGVLWGYSRSLIEPDRPTVASMLQRAGYSTACVGKWHLGFQSPDLQDPNLPSTSEILKRDHPQAVDYSVPLTPGPNTVGFDYFFGIPASLDMDPYMFVENAHPVEPPTTTVPKSLHRRQQGGGFWRGGKASPSFRHIDVLPKFADKAVDWIKRQKKDQPFFLYFPLSAPHTPWLPLEEFRGLSVVGYYGDFVMQVDDVIGRVSAALEERGLSEDTLFIVTSDNGSHWPADEIDRYDHAANMHYRGQKSDIWEGGHRIPFIARLPGKIEPGTISQQTICLTDLTATAVALAEIELPANAAEDSFNLLPAMLNPSLQNSIRPHVVNHSGGGTFAIRDDEWKLIPGNLGSGGFTKPARQEPQEGGPQGQLYNLKYDRSEATNVYQQYPEVVARLTDLLRKVQDDGRSRP